MASSQKTNKTMTRPLPSSLAPDDVTSTDLGGDKNKPSVMASNSAKVGQDKVVKSKAPFRHKWQKTGRFVYQEALLEAENADGPEGKGKQQAGISKQLDAGQDGGAESGDEATVHPRTGGKQYTGGKRSLGDGDNSEYEESDMEFKREDSDGEYAGGKKPVGGGRKKQKYEMKTKQPNPNGRVPGRKLVMWHRPHMIDKLMLHLQYECHRAGVKLPWNKIVERLSPGSSGQSALQHLNKLRDILISEGHMVPPLLGKASVPQDPTVRGYIRNMEADKATDTRVIRWGEYVEDLKQNLQDVGVVRGSGNYRRLQMNAGYQRGLSKALEKRQQATDEVPIKKEKPTKEQATRAVAFRAESPDPADLSSDDEYDPSADRKKAAAKPRRVRRSTKPVSRYKVESDDETIEEFEEGEEETIPARVGISTPQKKRHPGHDQCESLMTPPATTSKVAIDNLMVKMKLRPDLLRRVGSREPKPWPKDILKEETDGERYGEDMENSHGHDGEGLEDEAAFDELGTLTRQNHRQTSVHPFALEIIQQRTGGEYQGIEEHGTRAEYMEAINHGTDPKANGLKYKLSGPGKRVERPTEYKLAVPPEYTSPNPSQGISVSTPICALGGSFDGSSADAGSGNHNGHSHVNSMSGLLLGEMMGGIREAEHIENPFFEGPGSAMFQTGSALSASGLPAPSYNNAYHGQPSTPNVEYSGIGYFALNTTSSTLASSTDSGFHNATDGTAATTPNIQIHDDGVSTARSSPAPYANYIFDHTHEEKENLEYMEMEMEYF